MNRPYTIEDLNDGKADKDFNELIELCPSSFPMHMPKSSWLSFQLFESRLAALNFFNLNLNYFALRHRLPINTKRAMDIAFCIHYVQDHIQGNEPASWVEKLRYKRLWYRHYGKEINLSAKMPYQKGLTKLEKKFYDLYAELYWALYITYKQNDELDYYHNRVL